jgi:hypothetical protein
MEDALFIKISKRYKENMTEEELYEATRGVWVAKKERLKNIKFAFALFKNRIVEVYNVEDWFDAGTTEYKTRTIMNKKNRYEFTGKVATEIRDFFIGKSVSRYYKRGEANPIKYFSLEQLQNEL